MPILFWQGLLTFLGGLSLLGDALGWHVGRRNKPVNLFSLGCALIAAGVFLPWWIAVVSR